jgi:hypothetical protein
MIQFDNLTVKLGGKIMRLKVSLLEQTKQEKDVSCV